MIKNKPMNTNLNPPKINNRLLDISMKLAKNNKILPMNQLLKLKVRFNKSNLNYTKKKNHSKKINYKTKIKLQKDTFIFIKTIKEMKIKDLFIDFYFFLEINL